jgi:hypothetical protein
MRIELQDANGYNHTIDSENAELLGKWLADWMPIIMDSTQRFHYPWRISVWPMSETEGAYIKHHPPGFVNSERMRVLATDFEKAAVMMEKVERRTSG